MLRGTSTTISNNITGSNGDQWRTTPAAWTVTRANQIPNPITYYQQYPITISYSTQDSSAPNANPTLKGTRYGAAFQLDLNTATRTVWADANTVWSTDQTLSWVSGEQWVCAPTSSGTLTAPSTLNPTYVHQYYLTVSSPYGAASGSGWYNSSSAAYAGLDITAASGGTGTRYAFVFLEHRRQQLCPEQRHNYVRIKNRIRRMENPISNFSFNFANGKRLNHPKHKQHVGRRRPPGNLRVP